MGTFGNWMILTPILVALMILAYYAWQAFKEINPTIKQVRSLHREIQKTKGILGSLMAEVQSSKTKAVEQAENAKELISYSKETYQNVKNVFGAVKSLDMLPIRRAISFVKEKRAEHGKPEMIRYVERKARKVNLKLHQSQLGQLASLLGAAVLSASVTIFAIRKYLW